MLIPEVLIAERKVQESETKSNDNPVSWRDIKEEEVLMLVTIIQNSIKR
jgi:hypothetical protein